jgi:hypothetical protein
VWVGTPKNLLIHFFDVLGLEGRPADDECIKDNANRPGVNLEAVSVRGVEQYLWCDIVGRATNGLLPLAGTLNKRGKAKVTNLDVHVCIKEKIAKLQITVDDLMGMHVMAGTNKLYHEKSGFRFGKDATVVQHTHKRTVGAEFQGHIDVRFILEAVYKTDNVRMV